MEKLIMPSNRRKFLSTMGLASISLPFVLSGCKETVFRKKNINISNIPDTNKRHCFTDLKYDFYGQHQSGIITPQQRHAYFLVADLHIKDKSAIMQMFKDWTVYAANLMQGKNIQEYGHNPYIPPVDTGEADSLSPYGLTLTFGISPSFLKKLGLSHKAPAEFKHLPSFPRDQIRERLSGGDICIQACAEDPQVAFHAVRQLVRSNRDKITMKWSQSGFTSFDDITHTPRNLFAFKDGTANHDTDNTQIWIDDTDWLKNGTYLVARIVRMHLETWDRTSLKGQEDTFGRHRNTGAPIGKSNEFAEMDIHKHDEKGELVIPADSHVGLAKRTGLHLFRRSYSFASGIDTRTSQFDAGLLFISFQKSPEQFISIQNALGNNDKMTEYTTHIGSGLFACFGGVNQGGYLGQALFEG